MYINCRIQIHNMYYIIKFIVYHGDNYQTEDLVANQCNSKLLYKFITSKIIFNSISNFMFRQMFSTNYEKYLVFLWYFFLTRYTFSKNRTIDFISNMGFSVVVKLLKNTHYLFQLSVCVFYPYKILNLQLFLERGKNSFKDKISFKVFKLQKRFSFCYYSVVI